jgi:glycosyltransferase involved in cell wall biosynthesis
MSKLKVTIVTSALPPRMDGIGDHSSGLAGALAQSLDVTVYTARGFSPDAIPGVDIVQSFDIAPRRAIADLESAMKQSPADWIILQYNPFCFGKRGINPFLAGTIRRIKQNSPNMKLAVMVHEMWMHTSTLKYAILSMIQRRQFAAVTSQADLTLFSTGPWADNYQLRYPDRKCVHMPVGSNLPYVKADREAIRRELGFADNTIVLGSFGGNHPSRLFDLFAKSARRLKSAGFDVRILSIGSAGPAIRESMPELPLVDLGSLVADEVSRKLQAIDIYMSPFFDGVSTRRGSFFAGIQHGLATVTTRSYHSDSEMLAHDGKAFLAPETCDEAGFISAVEKLAAEVDLRRSIGAQARICFERNYSLAVLAERWRSLLQPHCDTGLRPVLSGSAYDDL